MQTKTLRRQKPVIANGIIDISDAKAQADKKELQRRRKVERQNRKRNR